MASGSSKLQPRERVAFRKAYQQAWTDLCSSELQIPSNLPLFVLTSTSYTVVTGNSDAPFRVFVTADPLLPETKAVLAAGEVVLELSDEELVEPVIEKLRQEGGFDALPIDAGQVGVLVDHVERKSVVEGRVVAVRI